MSDQDQTAWGASNGLVPVDWFIPAGRWLGQDEHGVPIIEPDQRRGWMDHCGCWKAADGALVFTVEPYEGNAPVDKMAVWAQEHGWEFDATRQAESTHFPGRTLLFIFRRPANVVPLEVEPWRPLPEPSGPPIPFKI